MKNDLSIYIIILSFKIKYVSGFGCIEIDKSGIKLI